MNKETYYLLENFMLCCMEDTAHDKEHIYRVLYNALEIAKTQNNVNYDILIAACLLHDIGRQEQFENPALCHAIVGSEKAYQFLLTHGFEMLYAEQVSSCPYYYALYYFVFLIFSLIRVHNTLRENIIPGKE